MSESKKLYVVTGAGGGLGSALCARLVLAGHYVAAVCRNRKPGLTLFSDVGRLFVIGGVDLSGYEDAEDVFLQVEAFAEKHALNAAGLINIAGNAGSSGVFSEADPNDFFRTIRHNLLATMHMCHAMLQNDAFKEAAPRHRTIINTSSIVAKTGAYGASAYAASKGGIEAFTRSLALEVAKQNVTVNCIAPGYLDAGMIKEVPPPIIEKQIQKNAIRRLGTATEFAATVEMLLSEELAYITGQVIHLDGGRF